MCKFLAYQLTLSQPVQREGIRLCLPHYYVSPTPSDFQTFLRPCHVMLDCRMAASGCLVFFTEARSPTNINEKLVFDRAGVVRA